MSFLESVYDRSPIWLQHLMVSLSGYQRNRNRYGKAYRVERAFLAGFDRWPLDRQLAYQRETLLAFIRHAHDNSPFYRELYQDVDLGAIHGVEDLHKLPIVDKEMLRANADRVLALPKRGLGEWHTGGTTGKSLVVYNSRADMMKRMAMLDHFKARVGFEHLKMRRATFNGKHIVPPGQKKKVFWRYNAACKQMIYSSFFLTEDNMGHYVDSLNRFKPQAIDGFFTSMLDLAGYIERHRRKLTFTPVAIFPTSETLTPAGREQLERVFGCKVYDQYASSEGAPFVTECPNQVLHMELASGVFEQMDDSGEILVTSFTTHGTPLIRYRIGDRMVFANSSKTCDCGLQAPIVESIEGRRLDFLYTPDGAKINAGNVANLLKNMPNAVIRAQFHQEKLDEITVLLEVDKAAYKPDYDKLLLDEFRHKFGVRMQVNIRHVDEIPREKSGKFRMIMNLVQESGQGRI